MTRSVDRYLGRRRFLRIGAAMMAGVGTASLVSGLPHEEQKTLARERPIYRVLTNSNGSYRVWFIDRELPDGWFEAGFTGTDWECRDYIHEMWDKERERHRRTP